LASIARRLLGIELLFGLFNQRQHITHAKDAACHAVGVKLFKRIQLFTDTYKLDWNTCDSAHAKNSTAARIAIQLSKHHTRQLDGFVEGLGRRDRVLTGHGIQRQQGFLRLHSFLHLLRLAHHVFINVQTPAVSIITTSRLFLRAYSTPARAICGGGLVPISKTGTPTCSPTVCNC
jgi:hypothetical protein